MPKTLIGTSGWTYAGWRGKFYPQELPSRRYLEYYASQFVTTEVNYSFYHLPRPKTYQNWAAQVPADFVFALKASRLITHTKRLHDVEAAWRLFLDNALSLSSHLGPILLQFPASFHQERARLLDFLELVHTQKQGQQVPRLAFEFRHDSWLNDEIYNLLKQYGAALCIADSPAYPRRDVVTANFTYMRYHGRTDLFASSYSSAELAREAEKIGEFLDERLDIYVYFNNDAGGHAVENARTLVSALQAG